VSELANSEFAPSAEHPLRRAITPLRLVFWGGMLLVSDVTVSSDGFKFDVLDDTVGAILITIGVYRLAAIPVSPRYDRMLAFVRVVCILAIFDTALDHFIFNMPEPLAFALSLLAFVELVATVCFCVAMRWASQVHGLVRSARSWRVTMLLYVLVYPLPLGTFYLITAAAIATNQSFHIDLGPVGLLLLPVFAAPIVHLFVSTSRMKREALEASPSPPDSPAPGDGVESDAPDKPL